MSAGSVQQVQDPATDEDLLERFRQGDPDSVGHFYRRYCRPVYLYAFSLTRDPAQAEDVVQQAFLRLLEQDPRRVGSVRGLLYTIVRNLVRDVLRRAVLSRRTIPILEPAVVDGPADADRSTAVSRALNGLPDEQREVVVLRIYADLPFAEIALAVGIPEATAKSRYRTALSLLETLLAGETA